MADARTVSAATSRGVRSGVGHMIDRSRLRAEATRARQISVRILEHPANAAHPGRALARAGWWQVRKRAWPRPVDIAFEGFTLRCHRDNSSASNVWYFTSRYDYPELTFLDRYLRLGDHVLDVGANIGTYSLFMAARIGVEGRVVAIEAEPVTVSRLRHNIAANGLEGRVVLHDVAVDSRPGQVEFFNDLDVANAIAPSGDARGSSVTVRAATLDDLTAGSGPLAVAKMDVEGVEVRALEGAASLLARRSPPVWITEVIATQLRRFGSTVDDLYRVFADAGYEPCVYDVDANRLLPAPEPIKGNVLFVATTERSAVEQRLGIR